PAGPGRRRRPHQPRRARRSRRPLQRLPQQPARLPRLHRRDARRPPRGDHLAAGHGGALRQGRGGAGVPRRQRLDDPDVRHAADLRRRAARPRPGLGAGRAPAPVRHVAGGAVTARYVAGRVGQALLVLWAAYTLSFLLLGALPGDGILIKFENPELGLSADQVAAIREYYRVDDPLLLQYVHALVGTLQGDLGYSVETATPVVDRVSAALPATLLLASLAFVVAAAVAVVLALAASYARGPWLHNAITAIPSLFVSVPAFWLGIVLLQVFSF